jgi:hypothetical protein
MLCFHSKGLVDWGAPLVQVVVQQASGFSGEIILTLAISKKDTGHEEGSRQATLRAELIHSATKLSGAHQNRAACCATDTVVAFFFPPVTSRGFINLLNDNINAIKEESLYGENKESGADINREKIA